MSSPAQISYACFDELIAQLRAAGHTSTAERLDYLLHHVAWTTSSELLGELGAEILQFQRSTLVPRMPKQLSRRSRLFREAEALAGLGRLDEALNLFEECANDDDNPLWLYWTQKSRIYACARRWQEQVEAEERAAILDPENATLLVSLAFALARHRGDARRAKEVLERAKKNAISETVAPLVRAAEGAIALQEGDADKARIELESALAEGRRRWSANPTGRVTRDMVRGHLALAYAQLGEAKRARRYFRQAEPRIRALGWDDLLERCEHALGAIR